jgi:cyclomaltodextrinase
MVDGGNRLQVLTQHECAGARQDSSLIALDLLGGDVWAWKKQISGTCPGCPPDATIALRVNDAFLPVERDGERFRALVALAPGENRVAAVLRYADGKTVESEPVFHTVRLAPRPTARIAIRLAGDEVVFDATSSEPSQYDHAPIERWMWSFRADNPAAIEVSEDLGALIVAKAPETGGEYFVSLTVTDAEGREDTAAAYIVVENGLVSVPDPLTHEAAWIERATVYGAIPFTFGESGFNSVADRLDDLRDLGIAAIWLSPSNRTLPGDFGYAVTDYFDTRPDYGTKEDLRALVQAAHDRGIRVLMDFVPNHSSIWHPYFSHMDAHGPSSPYYNFYDRDENGHTTFYFHYTHLHNLNFDNPEVWNFMIQAFAYWVREYDIDGFRVDVAWGIRQRRPDFWPACNRELKRIKPDSLLIAEASVRDPFYVQHGFDASYDWTDQLGHWAWEKVFDGETPIAEAMTAALTNDGRGYHPDSLIFRFLNNNDTGPRFITTHGVDCYRVASTMLMTLPGIPCVFSGDEVGADFLPYDKAGAIDWTDRHGLRDHFKRLIALRAEQPSLHSRQWAPLAVEPASSMFGYLRLGKCAPILVLLNFSGDAVEATVALPAEIAGFGGELTDLYADEQAPVAGEDQLTIPMPAWGVRILTSTVA